MCKATTPGDMLGIALPIIDLLDKFLHKMILVLLHQDERLKTFTKA